MLIISSLRLRMSADRLTDSLGPRNIPFQHAHSQYYLLLSSNHPLINLNHPLLVLQTSSKIIGTILIPCPSRSPRRAVIIPLAYHEPSCLKRPIAQPGSLTDLLCHFLSALAAFKWAHELVSLPPNMSTSSALSCSIAVIRSPLSRPLVRLVHMPCGSQAIIQVSESPWTSGMTHEVLTGNRHKSIRSYGGR